jgi:hypothetical protein
MSTGGELIEALSELAPLEWARFSRVNEPSEEMRPPLTVWRFADHLPGLEGAIERAVLSFAGKTKWNIRREGRNWVIQPEAVYSYPKRAAFQNDVELAIAFGREHPQVVREAFDDLPRLAEHVLKEARASSAE